MYFIFNNLQVIVAERAGFEPAVRLPLHTLSKRAPSTARTPLRISGLLIVCRAQQNRKSLKGFPFPVKISNRELFLSSI
jgi:hypothetical protein